MIMTPEDLCAAVREALDGTEKIANEAAVANLPPWRWGIVDARNDGLLDALDCPVLVLTKRDIHKDAAAHIVHNDPSSVLRRVAADRRVLDRHAPRQLPTAPEGYVVCGWCDQGPPPARHVRWPCSDASDLADRYGITKEEPPT